MKELATIGVDIAKSVFQLHGIDAEGKIILRRKVKRRDFLTFFTNLHSCLIGMEACSSAHHWGRELTELIRMMDSALCSWNKNRVCKLILPSAQPGMPMRSALLF